MRVREHELALRVRTDFVPARLSPGNKKLLFRCETILVGGARFSFHRFLESKVSKFDAAKVADAFTQHELAVFVHAAFHCVAGKLIDHTLATTLEFLVVCGSPPALELACAVILRALIVESV